MEHLAQCESPGCQIVDETSGQIFRLTVPDDWACQAYRFEPGTHFWPGDKSPDGLLLIRTPKGESFVCFIELKSGKHPDWSEARDQMEMGVSHFAPFRHHAFLEQRKGQETKERGLFSHGDKHHERWQANSDPLPVPISGEHEVICLVVTQRSIGRRSPHFHPGRPLLVCGKRVRFAVVEVPRKNTPIAVDELLRKASIYSNKE